MLNTISRLLDKYFEDPCSRNPAIDLKHDAQTKNPLVSNNTEKEIFYYSMEKFKEKSMNNYVSNSINLCTLRNFSLKLSTNNVRSSIPIISLVNEDDYSHLPSPLAAYICRYSCERNQRKFIQDNHRIQKQLKRNVFKSISSYFILQNIHQCLINEWVHELMERMIRDEKIISLLHKDTVSRTTVDVNNNFAAEILDKVTFDQIVLNGLNVSDYEHYICIMMVPVLYRYSDQACVSPRSVLVNHLDYFVEKHDVPMQRDSRNHPFSPHTDREKDYNYNNSDISNDIEPCTFKSIVLSILKKTFFPSKYSVLRIINEVHLNYRKGGDTKHITYLTKLLDYAKKSICLMALKSHLDNKSTSTLPKNEITIKRVDYISESIYLSRNKDKDATLECTSDCIMVSENNKGEELWYFTTTQQNNRLYRTNDFYNCLLPMKFKQ